MIIYQVTPCRLYPEILKNILISTGIESMDFHYPFDLKDDENYNNKNNIMRSIPKNFKHLRFNGFLYGSFNSLHLNRENKDFVFTIVNNPIDHIYEIYAYWNFVKHIENRHPLSNIWQHKMGIELIKNNQFFSIEEYIDAILNQNLLSIKYKDVEYEITREIIFGYNPSNFDYIGKLSSLDKAFLKLSEVFNSRISDLKKPYYINAYNGHYYRRKDLEDLLKPQLDFYNSLE